MALLTTILGITASAGVGQDNPSEGQDNSKPPQSSHRQDGSQQSQPDEQHAPQPRQDRNSAQQKPAPQTYPDHKKPEQQHAHAPHPESTTGQPPSQSRQTRPVQQSHQPEHSQQIGRTLQTSPEQQSAQRSAWQQHRAGNWLTNHRTWEQRGGYHGYRIPDLRFAGSFGHSHGFRIRGLPFMLEDGFPRFQYGGYWVSVVDPWPEYWGDDWFESDEVYVNYVDDGYYLFDDRYPSAGIAVSISM